MKQKYFLILLLFIGIISSYGQYTSIPDANFEAGLEELGYDDISGDGQVQNTDSNAVITQIGISGYSVNDVDLNGQVQNTDVNIILQNVGKGEQF